MGHAYLKFVKKNCIATPKTSNFSNFHRADQAHNWFGGRFGTLISNLTSKIGLNVKI